MLVPLKPARAQHETVAGSETTHEQRRATHTVEWNDVIGVVHGGGGRAGRSGTAFGELVGAKHARA